MTRYKLQIAVFVLLIPLSLFGVENELVISGLSIKPGGGPRGTVYTISFQLNDDQKSAKRTPLLFQVREGREATRIQIHDDGVNGDVLKDDGIFTGVSSVPATASFGHHLFTIFVRDEDGRVSNTLNYSFNVIRDVTFL